MEPSEKILDIFNDEIHWKLVAFENKESHDKIKKIMAHNLKILCLEIIKRIPNVISIYLTGGYVASEGCIMVEEDKIKILSDYDLVVIVNGQSPISSFSENVFSQLKNIYKMSGHPIAELIIWDYHNLRKLMPSKFLFDFQLAKCIYGKEIRNLIPRFLVSDIPSTDGLRLIFNRVFGVLLPFSPSLIFSEPTFQENRHITFESSKLVMASCEAFLMLDDVLYCTQKENVKYFSEIFPQNYPILLKSMPKIQEIVQKALEYRIAPNVELEKNAITLWFDSRDLMLHALEHYLKIDPYQEDSTLIELIFTLIEKQPHAFIQKLVAIVNIWQKYGRINIKMIYKKPYIALLAVRVLLLFSIKRDGTFDKMLLNQATAILDEHVGIHLDEKDPKKLWELLKQHAIKNYFDPFVPFELSFKKQLKNFIRR